MSVRTKVLVTVATVATMTAIGTTRAYGLENKSVENILKEPQVSINKSDEIKHETKDLNINEDFKSKTLDKIKVINKVENKESLINKNKTKKEEFFNEEKENKELLKDRKQKIIFEKKEIKQPVYYKNEEVRDVKLKREEKNNNIVEGKVVKAISKVNVRESASVNSVIIGKLSLGEKVKVDKNHSNKDWYGICFGEHGGFVSIKYIEIKNVENEEDKKTLEIKQKDKKPVNNMVEGQIVDVLSKLNIRESPSLNAQIIGQLSLGEKVKIDKNHSNKDWYGICFGEHGGFVSTQYVKLNKIINDDKPKDKVDDHKEVIKEEAPKKEASKEVAKDKEESNFILGQVINISSHLNVREKPTTKCEVIGKIYEGNQVSINKAKSKDGWYEISFGNRAGYVSSNYIKIIKKDYLITDALVKFVASYEGYSATAYRGADYQNRTIGYGHVIMPGETYSYLTEPEARNLLKSDLNVTATRVKAVLDKKDMKLNTHQFDSLVSFAYNCGVQGLTNSRLLRDIQNKASLAEIKDAFLAWRHCNGIELEGLRRRRIEEFEMYSTGDYIRDIN